MPADEDNARPAFQRRRIHGPLRGQLVDFVFFGLPFCSLVIWMIQTRMQSPALPWVVGAVVLIWIVGFTRQWRRMHRLRCPQCQSLLRRQTTQIPERVVFRCEGCRIEWDTGFTETADVDG